MVGWRSESEVSNNASVDAGEATVIAFTHDRKQSGINEIANTIDVHHVSSDCADLANMLNGNGLSQYSPNKNSDY